MKAGQPTKPETPKPSLSVDSKQIKNLIDYNLDDVVNVSATGKITRMSAPDNYSDTYSATIELSDITISQSKITKHIKKPKKETEE